MGWVSRSWSKQINLVTFNATANAGGVADITVYNNIASTTADKTAVDYGATGSYAYTGLTGTLSATGELAVGGTVTDYPSSQTSSVINGYTFYDGALYSSCSLAQLTNILSLTTATEAESAIT